MSAQNTRHHCATMPHHNYLAETDEVYQANRRNVERYNASARIAPRTSVIRIPVVVHVLFRTAGENLSREQIDSQIEALNRDFRFRNSDAATIPAPFQPFAEDALIEFALAVRDPSGAATTGITRTRTSIKEFPYDPNDPAATSKLDSMVKHDEHGKAAWPRDSYLNMWVCTIENGLLGYAQFPGSPAATDGVVINNTAFGMSGTARAPFDLGRTAVHEVGHFFNLLHIWGDDRGACSGSDNVSDTPNQAASNTQKPTFPNTSCGNAPNGDMFMNYMDYVDDDTMTMFTKGQVQRMNAALSGPRAALAKSNGLLPVPTKIMDFGDGGEEAARTVTAMTSVPLARESGSVAEKTFDGVYWV